MTGLIRRAKPADYVFAGCLLATAVLIAYLTRDTTLRVDEWSWVIHRRGWDIHTFVEPHNGHLSVIPLAVYKTLFAAVGVVHTAWYRAVLIVCHLTVVTLVYLYARTRLGAWPAVVAASLLLVFGAGWQDVLWPFQIGYLISIGAGVGAFLAIDSQRRGALPGAAVLLAAGLASSGVGAPFLLGIGTDLALRRRWKSLWVVVLPLVLYAPWWLAESASKRVGALGDLPRYIERATSGVVAALLGIGGDNSVTDGTLLTYGRPALIVVALLVILRFVRVGPPTARMTALALVAVSFWVLTQQTRGPFSSPIEPRYLYVGAVPLLLLAVEVMRGVSLPRRLAPVVAVVAGVIAALHLVTLADGSAELRRNAAQTRAALAAVELAREQVSPPYFIRGIFGVPIVQVRAGQYFAMTRDLGRPAGTGLHDLIGAPPEARTIADAELAAIERLSPRPVAATVRSCVEVRKEATRSIPPKGVVLVQGDQPAKVGYRRFGTRFIPLTTTGRNAQLVRPGRDRSARPWQLRIDGSRGTRICVETR